MASSAPPETFFTPASKNIRAVTYHPDQQHLVVVFHGSLLPYVHTGVPREIFDSWRDWHKAGYSVGKFYSTHVKHFPLGGETPKHPKPAVSKASGGHSQAH